MSSFWKMMFSRIERGLKGGGGVRRLPNYESFHSKLARVSRCLDFLSEVCAVAFFELWKSSNVFVHSVEKIQDIEILSIRNGMMPALIINLEKFVVFKYCTSLFYTVFFLETWPSSGYMAKISCFRVPYIMFSNVYRRWKWWKFIYRLLLSYRKALQLLIQVNFSEKGIRVSSYLCALLFVCVANGFLIRWENFPSRIRVSYSAITSLLIKQ